ncbi:uncharacterized protein MKK02DRAFT_31798 [Dioszegia hungarica]|uniref:Uncharacterized protein n=1 Tax=Dioszegia hungarica TaxID=4972 RepID=A0AA38HD24_9TREE|nr:uncharacterized protein MKK02DRAFT_31798 [Dioszegia hungarica]KAI9638350.1 hypothetical protein MKK02DRAFT_31798 [Dioszegia hungarica]
MGLIPDPDDDQRTLDPEIESKRMCVTAAEVLNGLLQKALEDGHIFPDINGGYDEALRSWAIGVGAPAALDWELGSDHNFKCSVRECTKATIECDTLLIPSTNAEGNKTYTVKSRLRGLPEALGGQSVFSKAGLRTAGQELDSHLLTQVDEQIKAAATGDCPRTLSDPEVLEGLRSIGSDEFFKPLENFCLDCSLTSLNLGERPSDEAEGAKEETQ